MRSAGSQETFVSVTRGPTSITGVAGTLAGHMTLICGEDPLVVSQGALPQDRLLQVLVQYNGVQRGWH